MKYGVVVQMYPKNVGDDIWAYAASRFLPSIDYLIDRDYTSEFKSEGGEPVATIFAAYMMHKFHHFPPAKNIWMLPIGVHFSAGYSSVKAPVTDQYLSGVAAKHFNAFAPVGARDIPTQKALQKYGVDAYFSGCITLTLPKQEIRTPEKPYVCVVDLDKRVEDKVRQMLSGKDIEIRKLSHVLDKRRTEKNADWQSRVEDAEYLLKTYQNARCVITSRLHAALPCLAMEVPVFNIREPGSPRFKPYEEWLHGATPDEFLKNKYDYDFLDPKPNKPDYLPYRQALIERCTAFIESTKAGTPPEVSYTEEELLRWQNQFMSWLLDEYDPILKDLVVKEKKLEKLAKLFKEGNKALK